MTRPSYQCTVRDDGSLTPSSQYVAQTCNLVHNNIPRSARDFFSVDPSTASSSAPKSMATAPPERSVLSLLNGISPRLSVQELEVVPSARLQRLYNVKVTEGPSLLLALPPPTVMRLLRSEKSSIGSEAAVLKWLSAIAREKKTSPASGSKETLGRTTGDSSSSERTTHSLSGYLPILVRHESIGGGLAVEYNLSRPSRGVAVSALSKPLTHRERRIVDFQVGQLLRRISTQVSPTRRFGIAADVLSVPPSVVHNPARRLEGGLHESRGAESWRVAFHNLMEAILRDGEDLTIMLNYNTIRRHFYRFEHLLDAVTEPRLVVLDAGEDSNTLVIRPGDGANGSQAKLISVRKTSGSPERGENVSEDDRAVESDDEDEREEYTISKGQIEVTGLRQWSNCIFGDPLLASVFSKRPRPSQDFWRGFDKPLPGDERDPTLIEDTPNAHIRLILYECYHAVVSLVGEFYRPQNDGGKRELAARKHLGGVLARLEELDDSGGQRRRRMSGEMSPAKRPRSGEDEDDSDD
ncbi:hypothetical protein NCS57_00550600 [Fusarium keratoplasticum]|uniref:Uncharacterized protein n=1 Tax=Fusarium keratoplasticum TaxID=1328300 RepID=A0ACC0QZ96_9HYPO|nr:hypothetical protein NCS57_00550600 [Fusarium keratoplasticum]KAI8670778.1 hypothetical protein NCS57_00550600 [Fusarium keratoplasticum]